MEAIQKILNKAIEEYKGEADYTSKVELFFVKDDKIKHIRTYSGCRGFIYDSINNMIRCNMSIKIINHILYKTGIINYIIRKSKKAIMSAKYFYIYYDGVLGAYNTKHRITERSIELIIELLDILNYPTAEVIKHGHKVLIKLDIAILKNLYATSVLFLLIKHPEHINGKTKSFYSFIEKLYNKPTAASHIAVLKGWNRIFSKKTHWWTFYGYKDSLHDEGLGELTRRKTCFRCINRKVAVLQRKQNTT